jgi:hypothetical protein
MKASIDRGPARGQGARRRLGLALSAALVSVPLAGVPVGRTIGALAKTGRARSDDGAWRGGDEGGRAIIAADPQADVIFARAVHRGTDAG